MTRDRLTQFVEDTRRQHGRNMRTKEELFRRGPSAQDWVDACVIGGVSLMDAMAGNVTDADINPEVVEAFHAQYPGVASSFVDKVRELHEDPDALRGLISGIKGKLFEEKYVDALNDGVLPDGATAQLAESATQPGWDIQIVNSNGEVIDALQLKATESAGYIREAIDRYPDFEVVVPTEVYADLSSNADLVGHLVDSGIHSEELMAPIGSIEDAVQVAAPDLIPEMAFVFIAASAAFSLYKGKDRRLVFRDTGRRLLKAGVVGGLAGLAAFAFDPIVLLPVAVSTRLIMSRREASQDLTEEMSACASRIDAISRVIQQPVPVTGRVRFLSPAQIRLLSTETGGSK